MVNLDSKDPVSAVPPAASPRPTFRPRLKGPLLFVGVLLLCFAKPLYDLAGFAWHSSLYSHILLIPFVSLYLVRVHRESLVADSPPARWWAVIPALCGLAFLGLYGAGMWLAWDFQTDDYLALMMLSLLSFLLAGVFIFLPLPTVHKLAFPLAFLLFMVPFPTFLLDWITAFLQRWSAEAASVLFTLSGMPFLREGMLFELPTGFRMEVAPECSGIHSTLVLFITSLLAGHLFLRTRWRRAALAFAVIPLALLRNGFRIFTLGQLCVHVSRDIIDSPLHHRGGPIFFALSLIPFFLLLLYLRKSESKLRRNMDAKTSHSGGPAI